VKMRIKRGREEFRRHFAGAPEHVRTASADAGAP